MSIEKRLTFIDMTEAKAVLGMKDEFLRTLQKEFPNCRIAARGNEVILNGPEPDVSQVAGVFSELRYLNRENTYITTQHVRYSASLIRQGQEELLHEAAKALKANPAEIVEKIGHLQGEVKALSSENESLKSKLAQGALGDVMDKVVEVKGVKLLAAKVDGVDMNGLRDLGDQLKGKLGEGVVLLAAVNGEKVNLLAMATDAAQKAGAHAGNLIKAVAAIVGGGGGGRPNMAQAGGKNPAKAQEAVDAAAGILEGQIK